ncbi:2,3-bisphosphoglycerate-independent phosphoglycerate mutase [Patescibacteria group bacterium]
MTVPKPIVLLILDGWGIGLNNKGNAITQAQTPNFDKLWNAYPHTQLSASGESVGLPRGEPGNSEAGHLNIGAGTIVFQSLPRINLSIADGSFFQNSALKATSEHVKKNNSALHLMGLIGSGGVHSNIEHLFAILTWAKDQSIENVFLHLFTDGRDSPPSSCLQYLEMVEEKTKTYGVGKIASIMGRFYAMDRDYRWNRTKIAYDALTLGKGKLYQSFQKGIEDSYTASKTDEFIEPIILSDNGKPIKVISDNDAVMFINFRIDRPRQLTKAFVTPNFETQKIKKAAFDPYAEKYGKRQYQDEEIQEMTTFKRDKVVKNLLFITMTEYEPGLPVLAIFPPDKVSLPLSRAIANENLRQLHIAETEKERHITYYLNGKRESSFNGEDWIVIPSPKVRTYDLQPEMSAYTVTDEVLKRIKLNMYDFIAINLANPDMVGHTGVLSAAIKACEVTDDCLGKIVDTTLNLGGICLVTADHGNVEEMIDVNTGGIDTKHSLYPVPFILVDERFKHKNVLPRGILADIAPTVLKLLNIKKPSYMTGKYLI